MRLNHETSSLLCGLVWLSRLLENNKKLKNVDCWSAHCYALADGKTHPPNIIPIDKLSNLF